MLLNMRLCTLMPQASQAILLGDKHCFSTAEYLVYSTAEYWAPVLCRSAHTRLIDATINDALRIVTGCLRPTPVDNLPILAGIQPAELRRRGATFSPARHSMEPGHMLHSYIAQMFHSALTCPSSAFGVTASAPGFGVTASAPVSDISVPTCTNWV